MEFIRRKAGIDIGITEDFIIVADHLQYRYIKIRRSKAMDCMLDLTKKITTKNEIVSKMEKQYFGREINETFELMMKYGILEYSIFPDDVNIEEMKKYKMPEGIVDKRFALEIAAFKEYERFGVSRFDIFNKIRNAEVTIIGVGGIGSNLAVMLSAYGVKKITIIDDDQVEIDNLVRQIFYKEKDCDKVKKVNALKEFLLGFTSSTEIENITGYITSYDVAFHYLSGSKLVIQTADKPKGYIDFFVNRVCVEKGIPVLFTHNNSIGPFYVPNKSACFECFKKFIDEDSKGLYLQTISSLEENTGSIYPADIFGAWLMSYYIMKEIVDFLIGISEPKSLNSLLSIRDGNIEIVKIKKETECFCNQK